MNTAPTRIEIVEGTSTYNIMFTICREYSGSQRAARLHAFFVALINSACQDFIDEYDRQRYYDLLQKVGTGHSSYQSAFEVEKEYPAKGLDLVREFSGALMLEASTKKWTESIGLLGIEVKPKISLDPSYFSDVNTMGFNISVIKK